MRHLHTGLTCHKPANGLVCHRLFQFGFSFGCKWSGGKQLVQINSLVGSVCVRDRDLDSPQGGLTLMVYLFGGWNLWLRTRSLRKSTRNTKNTASLYRSGPPKSKALHPVVGVDCLRIAYWYKGSPCPPYIGQQTRLVPRLLASYDQET
jgi:hypothetical protein